MWLIVTHEDGKNIVAEFDFPSYLDALLNGLEAQESGEIGLFDVLTEQEAAELDIALEW